MQLYQALAPRVDRWRQSSYPHDLFPVIGEILEWASEPDGGGYRLRMPQIRSLETYWYLRLVEETPHVHALYERLFPSIREFTAALGISKEALFECDYDRNALLDRLRTDSDFTHRHGLDTVSESLNLSYSSYIFALAMGSGKTALIGAIVATEFAMALEYPEGHFVENALVFAPGKTIIESLRELASLPYERILPTRLHKPFSASLKLTFTRDGTPDIPVILGSSFNLIVTNTEKIRIQKESIRKADLGGLLGLMDDEQARTEVANRRLQTIASLPSLAVFSDEAHHTYGRRLSDDLKKVRKTVDYLYENSPNFVCVVNTTGTPYFNRHLIRDVVIWYGLSQGIKEGILKELAGNVYAYDFQNKDADRFVTDVIQDFFATYAHVCLPDGAPAKIAIYFPQMDDLEELRPTVEAAIVQLGYGPETILVNTSRSSKEEEDAFNRLNDPEAPHRVILLVNKGTEGWNCPSLFACALARRLKNSNNFVLQAASRCLRQVPDNRHHARVYLSEDNRATLDTQLQETYGETLSDIDSSFTQQRRIRLVLKKAYQPPLFLRQHVRTVVPKPHSSRDIRITRPSTTDEGSVTRVAYGLYENDANHGVLIQASPSEQIEMEAVTRSVYSAALELATTFRVDYWQIHDPLKALYGDDVPENHVPDLARQIAEQTRGFDIIEEEVIKEIDILRLEGFDAKRKANGEVVYSTEITYPVNKESLILFAEELGQPYQSAFGFHYNPYNFDSMPEVDFYRKAMLRIQDEADEIDDILYTGAITNLRQTEFYIEYQENGRMRYYTPDFLIRRKDGRCVIVEIKSNQFREAVQEDLARHKRGQPAITSEGRKAIAMKKFAACNPEDLRYEIIYADSQVPQNQFLQVFNYLVGHVEQGATEHAA
ncbi:MAG: DEAD/DEAH box helicase family protein [Caldilineaceae bacterium]|nr:DEAD/DEAH box helicase family protein [Caldilineaceae bacterium]